MEKTMNETTVVDVTPENIAQHPQAICFTNPKQAFFQKKVDWFKDEFANGLRIKLLYLKGEKRAVGFVEYTLGEHCWRPVSASGYMFIHCLWTNGKKHQRQGLGSKLVREVEDSARGMLGVCVVTSDGPFMANKSIFMKNGYSVATESGKEQLLVKNFKKGPAPTFNDWPNQLAKHHGWVIVYSRQCPWVARFIEEAKPFIEKHGLKPAITELGTSAQAQAAPSAFGVFNLIHDGQLLADRYISTTRFMNILKKNK